MSQEGIPVEDDEVLKCLAESGEKRVFFRESSRSSDGGLMVTPDTLPSARSSPSTGLGSPLETLGNPSDGESDAEPGDIPKGVTIIGDNVEEASLGRDEHLNRPPASSEQVINNVKFACTIELP